MSESINHFIHPESASKQEPLFPHAPEGWTSADAEAQAATEGLGALDEVHWRTIICLQEYYARHDKVHIRELHDALDEKFHLDGGIKFLYTAFPKGPVAQGCRLAGLHAPADASSDAFGSVQ